MSKKIGVIGGGPAGLMAAEILSSKGLHVSVYDRNPSMGRKFLMAGRGGLNLTHSESLNEFVKKYYSRQDILTPIIREFPPPMLREWCENLGEKTFIGSSGRIFPESFKASPLLRAWMARLENQNVQFMPNHEWQGWQEENLLFKTPGGILKIKTDAALLALGGASWPRLGSDGSWVRILSDIAPLQAANCGFYIAWSDMFRRKFAGKALKPVTASFAEAKIQGEILITDKGIEGGAVYALSSILRSGISNTGKAEIILDLKPDLDLTAVVSRLKKPGGRDSFSNHLRKALKLSPIAIGLIMENEARTELSRYSPEEMAHLIKHYPLKLLAPFPIERAISTAGGLRFESLDENLMLLSKPGVFAAGEMLDWEAPTGGYLLQACFSTGVKAAHGILSWLQR